MTISIILNLTGLSFNLIGTIIISFSLRKYLKSVDNSFLALETSIESISSMLNNKQLNAFIIDGMGIHRKNGQKQIAVSSFIGLLFIVLGFALQISGVIILQ